MKYITKSGDTFDSIAFELFSHAKYTREIMEANKAYISTVIFDGGISLNIPEINETQSNRNLPPWRR